MLDDGFSKRISSRRAEAGGGSAWLIDRRSGS